MSDKKAILLGASGRIGRHIAAGLQTRSSRRQYGHP
jgi:hypothetical protein